MLDVPNAPVRIFDTSLTLLAEVDLYKSLYFTRGWNAPGDFKLQINWNIVDDAGFRHADYFQRGRFILVGGDVNKCGIILEVTKSIDGTGKGNQVVTVTGKEAGAILTRRIVEPPAGTANYTETSVAETTMKNAVKSQAGSTATANRQINILNVTATQARGASYTYSSRYKNLADDLTQISVATQIGWRLVYNPSTTKLDFECFQGVNRIASQSANQRMIISTDYDTLQSGQIIDSEISYKNIVYAAGQGVGDARNIRKVYSSSEPTGLERREIFTDMRDLVTNTDIDARGASVIAENASTKFVDAKSLIYTQYKIGTDYDLGDYITLAVYDQSEDVQITQIKESWSAGKYEIGLTFNRQYPEMPSAIRSNNQAIGMALANSDGVMVSSGSNSNGYWIKFSDGTMQQWGSATCVWTASAVGSVIVTFPTAFIGTAPSFNYTPHGTISGADYVIPVGGTVPTLTTGYISGRSAAGGAYSGTVPFTWHAIGKWK
jgi:hypothetical protein